MRRYLYAFVLGCLLGLCACVTVTPEQPVRAFRALPLVPEDWYRVAYSEMEACIGKKGDYDALRFFVVRDGRMGQYGGMWSWKNTVYIAEGYEMNGPLLQHEFGHHIEQGQHPEIDPVLARCGVLTIP